MLCGNEGPQKQGYLHPSRAEGQDSEKYGQQNNLLVVYLLNVKRALHHHFLPDFHHSQTGFLKLFGI